MVEFIEDYGCVFLVGLVRDVVVEGWFGGSLVWC